MVTRSCSMWKTTARINEIDKFIQLERNMYEFQLIWFQINKKISRRFIIGTIGKIFCLSGKIVYLWALSKTLLLIINNRNTYWLWIE